MFIVQLSEARTDANDATRADEKCHSWCCWQNYFYADFAPGAEEDADGADTAIDADFLPRAEEDADADFWAGSEGGWR